MTPEQTLRLLDKLVGRWTTEATHPELPGVVVRGNAELEWLAGERFLIVRGHMDHPAFPDSISMLGFTESDRVDQAGKPSVTNEARPELRMHYYDARGVFRSYDAAIDEISWRYWRNAPGFSQRFTGTFAERGATIVGVSQLCRDDEHWNDDLKITYRRQR